MRALDSLFVALGQDAGELVVPFLRTNNGGIFVEDNGNTWVSMRYVRHDSNFDWRNPEWCGEHCESAAQGLARFHAGAHPVLDMSKRVQDMLPATPITQISNLIESICGKENAERGSEISKLLWQIRDWLPGQTGVLVQSVQEAEVRTEMVSTVTHGDFHPGNCLFSGEQLRAIIDFEYVHSGSPVFDLAYGAAMFGTNWGGQTEDLIDRHLLTRFVGSYRREAKKYKILAKASLIDDDRYLDSYMRLSYILILIWCFEQSQSKVATTNPSTCLRIAEIAVQCLKLSQYPL